MASGLAYYLRNVLHQSGVQSTCGTIEILKENNDSPVNLIFADANSSELQHHMAIHGSDLQLMLCNKSDKSISRLKSCMSKLDTIQESTYFVFMSSLPEAVKTVQETQYEIA